MPKGRKPRPTHLKLAKGVDKKDPQRVNREEPDSPGYLGDPPKDLSKAEAAIWKRDAPDWGTDIDRAAFRHYVRAEADAESHRAVCESEGWWTEGSAKNLVLHPAARLYYLALDKADRILVEFGMTPSSRSRIKAPQRKPKVDPAAKFNL